MRFLADENCDFAVVRALRLVAHDVLAISEVQKQSVDREVIELCTQQNRVLITEDKDFGWLTYVQHIESPGVILIRFPAAARRSLADSVSNLVSRFAPKLAGSFVVLRPGGVRFSTLR